MVSKSFALLALSSFAAAKPHGHQHQHQHVARHFPEGTGPRGSGRPHPTGGMFPGGNSTGNGTWGDAPFPSGSGAGSIPVVTQTVVPKPGGGEGSVPAIPTGGAEGPGGGDSGAASPTPDVPSGGQGGSEGSTGGGKDGFQPPSDINNNNNSPSTDVSGAEGGAPGGGAGGAGGQCTPVTETSTAITYVTVTAGAENSQPSAGGDAQLTGVEQPSAGQFFGAPSGGFGGHGGQGQGSQGQAQPTTFATMPSGGSGGYGGAPSATGGFGGAPSGTGSFPSPTGGSSSGGNSTGGGAASGGKRGLSFNDAGILSAFDGTGMSWAYNWADSESGALPSGVEYVPMCWGADNIATCGQKAAGAKHVLSFNEPDLGEQADMTPEAAAQGHIKALNPLGAAGASIGSPAITNGANGMGIDWLNSWFQACGGQCTVDFVAFHWYDSASNIAYFKQHVQDVIDAAKQNGVNKVWCTEFGVTDGDAATFIGEATTFLDSTPEVERYAYFMAAEGNLIQGSGLSAAGKAYAGQGSS